MAEATSGPGKNEQDKESGAGRRAEGTTPSPPWRPTAPSLDAELVAAGERLARSGGSKAAPDAGFSPAITLDSSGPDQRERDARKQAAKKSGTRKAAVISIGVTALLAGSVVAAISSSNQGQEAAQVCRDETTQERVDDINCDGANSSAGRSSHIYGWYYYPRGTVVPGIGKSVKNYSGGTSTLPKGTSGVKNFSSTGGSFNKGTTSKGGFGKSNYSGKTFGG